MEPKIVVDARVQHGKPVIGGTRVPVARIVGALAGGMSREAVMRDWGITDEDISAALRYAAELVEAEEYHPLPGGPEEKDAVSG